MVQTLNPRRRDGMLLRLRHAVVIATRNAELPNSRFVNIDI
jgi:hypothetical protein